MTIRPCSDNRCSSLIHLNGTNVLTKKEEGTSGKKKKSWTYFGLCTFLVDELVMQTHISTVYFAIVKTKNEANARSYFKSVQKNHTGLPSPMQASFFNAGLFLV